MGSQGRARLAAGTTPETLLATSPPPTSSTL